MAAAQQRQHCDHRADAYPELNQVGSNLCGQETGQVGAVQGAELHEGIPSWPRQRQLGFWTN
jgi:hypothetical protein